MRTEATQLGVHSRDQHPSISLSFLFVLFVSFVLFVLSPPASAQELDADDPEAERRTFKLLDGFEVNLFAAEPMLRKPIHMTWDPQGRLWLVCSTTYPQVEPGQTPDDQIIVLEDTDGDGRADKSTVFAGGLYVPTGLELGDGGVYVANAPDLLFLKDTDGDGVADVRRIVLSGFGTEDNHHSISAWRWGPGGWLYFQEGTFLHAQVETPHGVVRLENGGVFQFRPRTLDLRVFADYRASNPWGHAFTRWGQSILIDNPNIYYLTPATANSRLKPPYASMLRGHDKHCGGEFISGRHIPEQFHGELWTNTYKAHMIDRYKVVDDGSGFSIQRQEPLLTSDSATFRPVDLKMGPDGAVYIADWYNPLIGHMQHAFRDPRRDKVHGRIWRVTYKGRPLVEKPKLAKASLPGVVEQLASPEDWTRYQAKRVLYDSDPRKVAAALAEWVKSLDQKSPGYEHHRLEALWAYQTIDHVEPALLKAVLASESGDARAAAVRVLRYWHPHVEDALALLEKAVADEHPRVRLEAVLTLSYISGARSVVIAMRAMDKPTDQFIDHALRLAAEGLLPHWLSAYEAGQLKFDAVEHESLALSMAGSSQSAMMPLLRMLDSGDPDMDQLGAMLDTVAAKATAVQLDAITARFQGPTSGVVTDEAIPVIFDALDRAASQRGVIPGDTAFVRRYITHNDAAVRLSAIRLAGSWKVTSTVTPLETIATSAKEPESVRHAAAASLGKIGNRPALAALEKLAKAKPPADRYTGVIGLASADLDQAAALAAEALALDPSGGGADAAPVLAAFLKHRGGEEALSAALEKSNLHPAAARQLGAYLNETGQQPQRIMKLIAAAGPSQPLDQQLLAEPIEKLVADVRKLGDAKRGEAVFRRANLACFACHALAGAGPETGPDLAAIGASAPIDYIVDSILQPSKLIKDQYENITVITRQGQVTTGILAFKDDAQVVVRDAARRGKEVAFASNDVGQLIAMPSLMPPGLAANLNNRGEFLDLVKYLSELGKPGDFAAPAKNYIRRWRVQAGDNPRLDAPPEQWLPAYSNIGGELPTTGLGAIAVVQAEIEVSQPGPVQMAVNDIAGAQSHLDGDRLPQQAVSELNLTRGRHTITFMLHLEKRGEMPLRVELREVPDSSARLRIVDGP